MRNQRIKNKLYTNLLLALVSFAILYFVVYPQYTGKGTIYSPNKNISKLLKEKKDYSTAVEVAASYHDRIIKINRDYKESLDSLPIEKINKILPAEADPIITIYELLLIANLPESRMLILSPRYIDDSNVTKPNKKYNTLTVSFSMNGTYEELKAFLKNLESSEKIYNVTSLDFSSSRDTKSQTSLRYNISVETYYLTN